MERIDPVQVVSEALRIGGPFDLLVPDEIAECAVTALREAGLLGRGEVVGYAVVDFLAPDPADTGGDWMLHDGVAYPHMVEARQVADRKNSGPLGQWCRVAALHLLPDTEGA